MKFLDDPETQADVGAAPGYVPIRQSAVDQPAVQQLWADAAGYKVAYDQLATGVDDVATQGPVIGDYTGVRKARDRRRWRRWSRTAISPEDARRSKRPTTRTTAITDYNERAGVGG